MATGRKGQQYGTVGEENGTLIYAWLDHDKKAAYKALCKKDKVTMSLDLNRFVSLRLAKAGVYDPSQSFAL